MTETDLGYADYSTTVRISDLKKHLADLRISTIGLGINLVSLIGPRFAARIAMALWGKNRMKRFIPRGIFAQSSPTLLNLGEKMIAVYSFHPPSGVSSKGKILLVHGWEGQASDFYRIIPSLLESGFEVVAFDGPAHGQSEGAYSNIFEFSTTIEKIQNNWGPFYCVIGHSMGGASAVITNYLSTKFKPEKIVTISSPNKLLTMAEVFANYFGLQSHVTNTMVQEMEKLTNLKISEVSMENYLKNSTAKIMIVHDEHDDVVPIARAEEIISKIEVNKFVVTKNLGHVKVLRNPGVAQEIVDFLEK